MCWWWIEHDSAATSTSSTTAETNSHACGVPRDDYGGTIQHDHMDHDERNFSHNFAADSAGRCCQHAPERPGRRDSDPDYDLYNHRHWTEWNSQCKHNGDCESDTPGHPVLSFSDRSVIGRHLDLDLVDFECDLADYRQWHRLGNTGIRQCDDQDQHDDNLYRVGPGTGRDRECDCNGNGFAGYCQFVGFAQHNLFFRTASDSHMDV